MVRKALKRLLWLLYGEYSAGEGVRVELGRAVRRLLQES